MTKSQIEQALSEAELSDLARALARKRQEEKPETQKGGRKRSNKPRCACGAMTLKRAKARGHKCA